MLRFLRRLLGWEKQQPPDGELARAKRRHVRVTQRADHVIAEAFRHADKVFYTGPERRKQPR